MWMEIMVGLLPKEMHMHAIERRLSSPCHIYDVYNEKCLRMREQEAGK